MADNDSAEENDGSIQSDGSEAAAPRGIKRRKRDQPATLRTLPTSPRHFWKESVEEQLSQEMHDRREHMITRPLPGHEIMAMALNEIAAHRGQGFFFHLPSRHYWKKYEDSSRLPAGRVPPTPRCVQYPRRHLVSKGTNVARSWNYQTLFFMRYAWTPEARAAFYRDSHRARYLRSSAIVSPPPNPTPLYAIQYTPSAQYPVAVTHVPTLVLLVNSDFHLTTSVELERLFGRRSTSAAPATNLRDRALLEPIPFVWGGELPASAAAAANREAIRPARREGLEDVYRGILADCQPWTGTIPATMLAGSLKDMLPRGPSPQTGIGLGETHRADASAR